MFLLIRGYFLKFCKVSSIFEYASNFYRTFFYRRSTISSNNVNQFSRFFKDMKVLLCDKVYVVNVLGIFLTLLYLLISMLVSFLEWQSYRRVQSNRKKRKKKDALYEVQLQFLMLLIVYAIVRFIWFNVLSW